MSIDHSKSLSASETAIPGLVMIELPVPGDNRGWFKENWQREKLLERGLPDLRPVQNNVSFNDAVGTTRGIHAEPWNKYVSVATGRIFGAWVDLRDGPTFGAVVTAELDPSRAIFVPRGVGNSYQTLDPDTAYTYLVDEHWSPTASYTFLNLADETIAIEWPVPLERAAVSTKDLAHPRLADVTPVPAKKVLVLGANGQLGRALRAELPDAEFVTRGEFDVTDPEAWSSRRWQDYGAVINAAAYTAVDEAETEQGRRTAWAVNVSAVGNMVQALSNHDVTIVHVSSDYVFDGTRSVHDEDEPLSPLGVYGQTKAAADALVRTHPRHYTLRTSWVIGDGGNFVRTMASLAERGVDPAVVDDQVGRLTFAAELARGIVHLLTSAAPFGLYNLSNEGDPLTWADVARAVFSINGHDPMRVQGVTTAQYFEGKGAVAARPPVSTFSLTRLQSTGFTARDQIEQLRSYLAATT